LCDSLGGVNFQPAPTGSFTIHRSDLDLWGRDISLQDEQERAVGARTHLTDTFPVVDPKRLNVDSCPSVDERARLWFCMRRDREEELRAW
jgi:hypothetical protein